MYDPTMATAAERVAEARLTQECVGIHTTWEAGAMPSFGWVRSGIAHLLTAIADHLAPPLSNARPQCRTTPTAS